MRKTAVNFEAVRALGRDFPDLQESTMYGSPALKLGKRLVACLAIHRSAEPGSLVVRTDFEQRAALLADDPETYYVTDHYVNHPVVLVRLARVRTTNCATSSRSPAMRSRSRPAVAEDPAARV